MNPKLPSNGLDLLPRQRDRIQFVARDFDRRRGAKSAHSRQRSVNDEQRSRRSKAPQESVFYPAVWGVGGAGSRAFTLIEVLVVMGIIFLLAGLLFPVMSKAKGKARQSECLNNLRQIGLAMQSFSHDHGGRFPMQVPDEDEGSRGANSEHLAIHTNLSFSTRHFHAIARELGSPKVLACPSDNRRVANSFSGLGLENISYWLNIQARPGSSLDYLGGDRNLSGSEKGSARANQRNEATILTFTKAIHGNRGNILFADGRVELLRTIQIEPTSVQDISENPASRDAITVLPSDSHPPTGRNPILAVSDLFENSRGRPTNSGEIRPRPTDIIPSPDKSSTNRPASRPAEVYPVVPSAMQQSGGARPQASDSASRPPPPRDLTKPGMDHASEDRPPGTLMELLLMRNLGIWLFIFGLILILLALTWYYLHRRKRNRS